eukprot:366102-Chlamydomonas_euryale.AAC.6
MPVAACHTLSTPVRSTYVLHPAATPTRRSTHLCAAIRALHSRVPPACALPFARLGPLTCSTMQGSSPWNRAPVLRPTCTPHLHAPAALPRCTPNLHAPAACPTRIPHSHAPAARPNRTPHPARPALTPQPHLPPACFVPHAPLARPTCMPHPHALKPCSARALGLRAPCKRALHSRACSTYTRTGRFSRHAGPGGLQ